MSLYLQVLKMYPTLLHYLLVLCTFSYFHHDSKVKRQTAHTHLVRKYCETVYDTTTRWQNFPACFRHCQAYQCALKNYYLPNEGTLPQFFFLVLEPVLWNEGLFIYTVCFAAVKSWICNDTTWSSGAGGLIVVKYKMHNVIVRRYLSPCGLLNCCVLDITHYIHILCR